MQRHFVTFDNALIERVFQPTADTISDRLGLSQWRAARFCIDLASLGWILSQSQALSDAVLTWDAGLASARFVLLLLGLVALTALRSLLQRAAGGVTGNPLRLAMRPHRAVVLLMLVARIANGGEMSMATLADLAMLGFATAALYLGACAARPPMRRRVGAAWDIA